MQINLNVNVGKFPSTNAEFRANKMPKIGGIQKAAAKGYKIWKIEKEKEREGGGEEGVNKR